MKKLFVVFFVLFISSSVFAQDIVLTKRFAGILYVGSYDKNVNLKHSTNFRVAGEVKLEGFIDLYGRAVYTPDASCGFFWMQKAVADGTVVKAGFMARPITFTNRPSPSTAGAQFESPALAVIPGSATGITVTKNVENYEVVGGVYYIPTTKSVEYDLGMSQKLDGATIKGGLLVGTDGNAFAATLKSDDITLTGSYGLQKNSIFCEVNCGKIGAPYLTMVYNRSTSLYSTEIGWTKSSKIFSAWNASGLIGAAYDIEPREAKIFVWMYVD